MNAENLSASILVISMERSETIEARDVMYSMLSTGVSSRLSSDGVKVSSPAMAAYMLAFTSCRLFIEMLYILFRSEK